MALYQYKARNARGEAVQGQLEAASADAAATQLLNSSVTPIEIGEIVPRRDVLAELKKVLLASPPTADDLILMFRQRYALSRAGVPRHSLSGRDHP